MSQPSVTAFFQTRKRGAIDDLRGKSKVLVLEHERTIQSEVNKPGETDKLPTLSTEEKSSPKLVYKASQSRTFEKLNSSVVRNIQFDSSNSSSSSPKTPKMNTRARTTRARKFSTEEGQTDIRDSFLKINNNEAGKREPVTVPFEKRGLLSPKKNLTPTKKQIQTSQPAAGSTTPKKSTNLMEKFAKQEMSLGEIKNRINKSSRLAELKARIDQFKQADKKLDNFLKERDEEREDQVKPPKIKKFEKIELEVPVSPQKAARSPMKTPTKNQRQLLEAASPQRRLLFEPKETPPSPVKSSPTKVPAYQRFQSLAEKETTALPLPYNYRFLAEVFRCIDTVVSMLFNRNELITFTKLKPAVQKLLRRNISLEHLAQIHTLYPDAFVFKQEKVKSFGCSSKQEEYDLCLRPNIKEASMGSTIQLERRRVFYGALLDRVKNEHEKFLLNLDKPLVVEKNKITRWHPDFDVDACSKIEEAELPQPPTIQKEHTAKEVLEKAKDYFKCNARMTNALEKLAKKNVAGSGELTTTTTTTSSQESSVVDTPPATPTTSLKPLLNPKLKGIPSSLLEKIRAKQAAKALEAMTRTPIQDIQVTRYSRLPEMARILQNIFVTEKKKILNLDVVIEKLDNSYRTKLSKNELDEHIKLICEKLPKWMNFKIVRKIVYLSLDTDMKIAENVAVLEKIANEMIKA